LGADRRRLIGFDPNKVRLERLWLAVPNDPARSAFAAVAGSVCRDADAIHSTLVIDLLHPPTRISAEIALSDRRELQA